MSRIVRTVWRGGRAARLMHGTFGRQAHGETVALGCASRHREGRHASLGVGSLNVING